MRIPVERAPQRAQSVANTSSASYPTADTYASPAALRSGIRASVIPAVDGPPTERVALYSGYSELRHDGPESNATTQCDGRCARIAFRSMARHLAHLIRS